MYYFRKTRLFSSHEPSPAKHSQNIPKTFSKHTFGHVAFRVRWRSIIGLAHERKRRSIDGSRFRIFSRQRTSFGHVARSDSPRFFAAFVGRFQQGVDVSFRHSRTTRTSLPAVRHPHPAQPRTCASPRPAPRASRPSSAPRATSTPPRPRSPSSRRRNASTPPNTMRGACAPDTPLRHAKATPTNATRANPPPERANCTAPDRRRRPRRDRRPRDAARRRFRSARPPTVRVFRSAQQPVATATRAGNGARGRRHRARSARSMSTLERPRRRARGRGGALAFARPLPPTRRTPTRRHPADTCSSFSTQTAHVPNLLSRAKKQSAANSLLARAGVAPSRTCPPRRRAAGSR